MSMPGHDQEASTAQNYRDFAAEAHGKSRQYEELATAVTGDPVTLAFLDSLPTAKRQPNLLFAAAYYLLGEPADLAGLHMLADRLRAELTATMLARRTQTNEPARCATLLPALALLPGPLALIEAGASAGLTLLVDKYSYDYAGHQIPGDDPRAPVLACEPRGQVPLPSRVPEVAWRAGLDLNPLDVRDEDDMRWLECLVWPGETGRRERLAAAIATARRDPPPVYRGDLVADLAGLAARAPRDATLVVFHSAVLAYVQPPRREQFASLVRELGAVWISNEGPRVVPGDPGPPPGTQSFVLIQDGRTIGLTEGHGAWLEWLPKPLRCAGQSRRLPRTWPAGRAGRAGRAAA